jgi:hypothetical protein
MKTIEVINHFKTGCKLAEECSNDGWSITPAAISQWGEYPPQGRQRQIESITKGKLRYSEALAK